MAKDTVRHIYLEFLRVDKDTVTHRLPLRSRNLGEVCK